jgi:hypothetical protein
MKFMGIDMFAKNAIIHGGEEKLKIKKESKKDLLAQQPQI